MAAVEESCCIEDTVAGMSSGDPSNGIRDARSFPVRPSGQYGDIAASLVARGGEGLAPPLCTMDDSSSKAKRHGFRGRDGADIGPVEEEEDGGALLIAGV